MRSDVGTVAALVLSLVASAAPAAGEPLPGIPAITVTASPSPTPTATFVTFTVRFNGVGGDGTYLVDFGDGTAEGMAQFDAGCVRPGSAGETWTLRHAYRRPGSWTFRVTYTPDEACVPASVAFTGETTVTVTPGASPSNGPERPRVFDLGTSDDAPAARAPVFASFEDYDGFVTRVVYTWGDGSPDTVFTQSRRHCRDPRTHWPHSGSHTLPAAMSQPVHHFPRPGSYRVGLTVTATGCDGRSAQTVTHVATVRVR